MAHGQNTIPIPGELRSVASDGRGLSAEGVYDYNESKSQETINQEVKAALGTGGSVDIKILNAINALDSTESQSAGADGLALNITEADGKITSISGSIAPDTYDAYGSASAAQSAAISAAATDATTKVNAAKSEIRGNATSACDTLGEAEVKINANTSAISTETSRAQAAEGALQQLYENLTQSDIVVVTDHTSVSNPSANTIYREQGTNTYSDWMYYNNAWQKMAEYDNAIDDEPTAGSNNLVKSGGVFSKTNLLEKLVLTRNNLFTEISTEPLQWANLNNYSVGDTLSIVTSSGTKGVFKNCNEGDVFYGHSEMGASYPRYCFVDSNNVILEIGKAVDGVFEDFFIAPSNTSKVLFMTGHYAVDDSYIIILKGRDRDIVNGILNISKNISLLDTKTQDIKTDKNYIDESFCIIDGYGIRATGNDVGALIPFSGWAASDFIEFDATKPFSVQGHPGGTFGIAFYSSKDESSCVGGTKDYSYDKYYDITVPNAARYFRMCNAYGNNWYIHIKCVSINIDTPIRAQVIQNTENIKQLLNGVRTKLNILAIGNSFTIDCIEYLIQPNTILDSIQADNINIYWAVQGGASLEYWWQQLQSGNITPTLVYGDGMLDEDYFDYIVIQQVSKDAADYSTFIPYLYKVIERLKQYNGSKTKIVWNMVWSRGEGTDSGSGVPYVEQGWERIVSTIKTMMGNYSQSIELILPTGTAIQNARGNNALDNGHGLTRDGQHQHLSTGTGRYIAASLWYNMLIEPFTKVKLVDISVNYNEASDTEYVSEKIYDGVDVDNSNRLLCQKCALYANANLYTLSQID